MHSQRPRRRTQVYIPFLERKREHRSQVEPKQEAEGTSTDDSEEEEEEEEDGTCSESGNEHIVKEERHTLRRSQRSNKGIPSKRFGVGMT